MMTKGLYSSTTCEWETPEELFDRLDRMYHFTLDVCATAENAKCERYFTKEDDGLQKEWSGSCWMNPPYGKEIAKWVKKAYETAKVGGVQWFVYSRLEPILHGGTITA